MRRQHWLAPVWATALLLTSVSSSQGQTPPPQGGFGTAPVFFDGPASDPYGAGGPGSAQFTDPGQIPPEFRAFPNVSPYESRYSQTYIQDGLWFNDTRNGPVKKSFVIDSLISTVGRPDRTLIGSEGLDPAPSNFFPVLTVGGAFDNEISGRVDLGQGPLIDDDIVGTVHHIRPWVGARLAYSWEQVDDSKVELIGWYQAGGEWLWRRGHGDENTPGERAVVTAAVPLFNGTGTVNVPYDQFFEVKQRTEIANASVNFIQTPRYTSRSGGLRVHGMWGLRYIYVNELFTFLGKDSGDSILFVRPPGTPDPATPIIPGPGYVSGLDSQVYSHLAGPQIGLNYEVGHDEFLISGALKFGLLANHERVKLAGSGMGDGFTDPNYDQSRSFSDSQAHTHVSPILEFNINAEFRLFEYIPILRACEPLRTGKFRAGYQALTIWNLARPGDTISWRGQPLDSFITMDYSRFYIHGVNLGVEWNY